MKGIALMEMSTIVPVVLALLLFFGSVVSAINTVNEKNAKIDMVFSLVQIVDRLTEAGVITEERFHSVVEILRSSMPVNFYVCVTDIRDTDYSRCSLEGSKPEGIGSAEEAERRAAGDYISATFPVTVQVDRDGVPFNEVKKILVMVWEGG